MFGTIMSKFQRHIIMIKSGESLTHISSILLNFFILSQTDIIQNHLAKKIGLKKDEIHVFESLTIQFLGIASVKLQVAQLCHFFQL